MDWILLNWTLLEIPVLSIDCWHSDVCYLGHWIGANALAIPEQYSVPVHVMITNL